jgi:hypothetical protein
MIFDKFPLMLVKVVVKFPKRGALLILAGSLPGASEKSHLDYSGF